MSKAKSETKSDTNTWKVRSRHTILDRAPWLVVQEHAVELPDGRIIQDWLWVQTPDYINVVVRTEEHQFLLFRQTKYGLDGTCLAVVGGYVQPAEDPLSAAKRELLEETGCIAPDWTRLGTFRVDPNRGIALGHLYLADNARKVSEPIADDLEEQEVVFLNRLELETALDRDEFQVLAWAAAVSFALRIIPF